MYGEGSVQVQTVGARTYDLGDLIFRRCAFPFTKLARFRTDYPVFLYQNHVNITTGENSGGVEEVLWKTMRR